MSDEPITRAELEKAFEALADGILEAVFNLAPGSVAKAKAAALTTGGDEPNAGRQLRRIRRRLGKET